MRWINEETATQALRTGLTFLARKDSLHRRHLLPAGEVGNKYIRTLCNRLVETTWEVYATHPTKIVDRQVCKVCLKLREKSIYRITVEKRQ